MKARGFTLVEVLMAMVVLEVGLLGVVGTLVLAARTLRRAEIVERVVTEAGAVYDSVWRAGAPGSGNEGATLGKVGWSVASDGRLRVEVAAPGAGDDSVTVVVRGRTLPAAAR